MKVKRDLNTSFKVLLGQEVSQYQEPVLFVARSDIRVMFPVRDGKPRHWSGNTIGGKKITKNRN